jgi:predicted membrane protein
VLPLLAGTEFGLTSETAAIGFLVAFGFAKAGVNFLAGDLAERIGRYRLWRDLGYAVGALFAGLLTDLLDFRATIVIIALLLVGSAAVARVLLPRPTRA